METTVTIQHTKKGLLIPIKDLGDLDIDDLEAVREERRIIIRPKLETGGERTRVHQVLQDAGLLYEPKWEPSTPVSPEERKQLAQKLGQSGPLSETIIDKREDRE